MSKKQKMVVGDETGQLPVLPCEARREDQQSNQGGDAVLRVGSLFSGIGGF